MQKNVSPTIKIRV